MRDRVAALENND